METFRDYILKSDKTHYDGIIVRDKEFKIIKVGDFEVGKTAAYTTPVKREVNTIIRFELPYVVFSCGRVEISHLKGYLPNRTNEEIEKEALDLFEQYGEKMQYSRLHTTTLIKLGKLKGLNN